MKPEEEARKDIDDLLEAAGWKLQNYKDLNLGAGLGVAVREFPLKIEHADYMLFVDRQAVGVVEAKPKGTTLSGVSVQTEKYVKNFPENIPHRGELLPFGYESTGVETLFRDMRDPDSRSRPVFAFHQPETLHEWLHQEHTLRYRLRFMPPLITEGLRDCQKDAIKNLERSFAEARHLAFDWNFQVNAYAILRNRLSERIQISRLDAFQLLKVEESSHGAIKIMLLPL